MARIKQLLVFYAVQLGAILFLILGDVNWWLVLAGWVVFCGLGSAVMMHRGLAHKTFDVPEWGKYLACLCVQGSPLWWVSTHRDHHRYADSYKDPHTPLWSHLHGYIGWLHKPREINVRCLRDYIRDTELQHIDKHYVGIVILAAVFLPWSFWLVPAAWSFHQEAIVNTLCHPPKDRPVLGLLTWGQAFHKAHHDKPNTFLYGRWDPCRLFLLIAELKNSLRCKEKAATV